MPKDNENPQNDEELMEGEPQHGDPADLSADGGGDPPDPDGDGAGDAGDAGDGALDAAASREDELRDEIEQLKAQMARLAEQRKAPPPNEQPPEDEVDWEDLLFTNPREALRLHADMVKREVQKELTGQYKQEQAQQAFWGDFYASNPDLKGDRDLVEMVLHRNMDKLANLPVEKASKKLADLTRDRILRYAGNKAPGGKKAAAEGVGSPQKKPPQKESSNVTTLSDVIRSRRRMRSKGSKGSAA